jgi:hypothetical protein
MLRINFQYLIADAALDSVISTYHKWGETAPAGKMPTTKVTPGPSRSAEEAPYPTFTPTPTEKRDQSVRPASSKKSLRLASRAGK